MFRSVAGDPWLRENAHFFGASDITFGRVGSKNVACLDEESCLVLRFECLRLK